MQPLQYLYGADKQDCVNVTIGFAVVPDASASKVGKGRWGGGLRKTVDTSKA